MTVGPRRIMADVSSNNHVSSIRDYWRDGHRLLMRKVTEGVHYVWSESGQLASTFAGFGGITWHYHYLRSGVSGHAQADYFWQHAKADVRRYDRLVVDIESMSNDWGAGEAKRCYGEFVNRMHTLAPHLELVCYSTSYFLRERAIRPVRNERAMLAGYPTLAFIPAGWKGRVLAHQFTQAGRAAGIDGDVDLSTLNAAALRPFLRRGDRNFAVVDAKHMLKRAGYGRGLFVSSMRYGAGMDRAVARYKRDHHLRSRSGAVFGASMWRRLG